MMDMLVSCLPVSTRRRRLQTLDPALMRRSQSEEETWPCGRTLSKKQLAYMRENCVVELSSVNCDENFPCAICLDNFCVNSPRGVFKLHCSHYFHEGCVTHWVVESNGSARCPLCKSLIPMSKTRDTFHRNPDSYESSLDSE
mmetsp:Transcript_3820/g.11372  ORF Transcript_3820/g.11372 Transcript_3820/m.11372 type:complete len:142 (+) Transcript_3820:69-494(+)